MVDSWSVFCSLCGEHPVIPGEPWCSNCMVDAEMEIEAMFGEQKPETD